MAPHTFHQCCSYLQSVDQPDHPADHGSQPGAVIPWGSGCMRRMGHVVRELRFSERRAGRPLSNSTLQRPRSPSQDLRDGAVSRCAGLDRGGGKRFLVGGCIPNHSVPKHTEICPFYGVQPIAFTVFEQSVSSLLSAVDRMKWYNWARICRPNPLAVADGNISALFGFQHSTRADGSNLRAVGAGSSFVHWIGARILWKTEHRFRGS